MGPKDIQTEHRKVEEEIKQNKLSYKEQFKLVKDLAGKQDPKAAELAAQLQRNYYNRGVLASVFRSSLSTKEANELKQLVEPKEKAFDKSDVPETVKTNPRRRWGDISSDNQVIRFFRLTGNVVSSGLKKVFSNKTTLANKIIPRTENHGGWDLGVQLNQDSLWWKRSKNKDKDGNTIPVVRVSMLTDREMVHHPTENPSDLVRLRWFDHGTLDATTGKNQTVSGMREFQKNLHTKLNGGQKPDVYCHCMAGRSRSFFETMAYMYYHPDQKKLLDVDDKAWDPLWEQAKRQMLSNALKEKRSELKQEIKEKLKKEGKLRDSLTVKIAVNKELKKWKKEKPNGDKTSQEKLQEDADHRIEDLKTRLKDNPSITDIGEFVRLQRPTTKPLEKLDGDQGGLLGLMSLDKMTQDGCKLIKDEKRDKTRLLKDAQNIGFSLAAPLDRAFRDEKDRKEQDEKFLEAYKAFKDRDVNLLMAMVVPISKQVSKDYNNLELFKANYAKLKPSEQVRFAILMQQLEEKGADLSPFAKGDAKRFAEEALRNGTKQLTAGDEVELLRTFGAFPGLIGYDTAVDRILGKDGGKGVNRHNAGIQLAELAYIAYQKGVKPYAIEEAIKGKNLTEQEKEQFFKHLKELEDRDKKNISIKSNQKSLVGEYKKNESAGDGVVLKLNEEKALQQFKDWIEKQKGKLTSEDKQLLVKQFMCDLEKHNPGNPERLEAILKVCTQKDLGRELYSKLKELYPKGSGTTLAYAIDNLREDAHTMRWTKSGKKDEDKVPEKPKVGEEQKVVDDGKEKGPKFQT